MIEPEHPERAEQKQMKPMAPMAPLTEKATRGVCRQTGKMQGAVLAGIIHFTLSLPFLLGLLTPSIHQSSAYARTFVLLNIGWVWLLQTPGDFLTRLLFGWTPSPNEDHLVEPRHWQHANYVRELAQRMGLGDLGV